MLGESLEFEWDATLSTWWVVDDRRKPFSVHSILGSDWSTSLESAVTWTNPGFDTEQWDIGGIYDSANGTRANRIVTVKRANDYSAEMSVRPANAFADTKFYGARIESSGTSQNGCVNYAGATGQGRYPCSDIFSVATSGTITPQMISEEGAMGVSVVASHFSCLEVLT